MFLSLMFEFFFCGKKESNRGSEMLDDAADRQAKYEKQNRTFL